VPYSRLRCAIPETLLAGDMAHMVGRAAGLSVSKAEQQRDQHADLMASMFNGSGCVVSCLSPQQQADQASPRKSARLSSVPPWLDDADAANAALAEEAARATSTAMLFALLWVRLLLPRAELAAREAQAAKHFSNVCTLAGSFQSLLSRFKSLLSGGNLHTKVHWLEKSRLWRLILLQNEHGFWDATPALAFALHSTTARPGCARGRPVVWQAPLRRLQSRGSTEWEHSDDDDVCPAAAAAAAAAGPAAEPSVRDDPLHFSLDGVEASMPGELRSLTPANADEWTPMRVWVTLLCVALVETLESCWIVSEEGEEHKTLVDLAEEWVQVMAEGDAALAKALPRSIAKAARMTSEWALLQEERVAALRALERRGKHRFSSQLQRLTGDVARALQTKHETCAGPPEAITLLHHNAERGHA
jgi:hypothetical protein